MSLTDDQKREILEQRLVREQAELFQLQLSTSQHESAVAATEAEIGKLGASLT